MTGFAGLLLTSTTGAKIQLTPRARASWAVIRPCRYAHRSDRVAPTAMFQGRGRVWRMRKAAPRSKSDPISRGTEACDCSRSMRTADP